MPIIVGTNGGPGDDVVVVVNLSHVAHENYKLGFPSPGTWRLRLNSDWKGYSRAFGNQACSDVVAEAEPPAAGQKPAPRQRDGFPAAGMISIGPYSVLDVFTRQTRQVASTVLLTKEPTHDDRKNLLRGRGRCLFSGGIGVTFIPNPELWGLFCIAIGLLLGGYDLGFRRRR